MKTCKRAAGGGCGEVFQRFGIAAASREMKSVETKEGKKKGCDES